MSYQLAIFDFDGTLADTFRWFISAVNRIAPANGFRPVAEDEVEELRGMHARSVITRLGVPLWKVPRLARVLRGEMARDIMGIRLFPGVREVLDDLARAGLQLAVVSSNAEANVRQVLGPDAAAHFRYWQCGAGLFGKRAKLRRVLYGSGIRPGRAISIGDEIRDLEAARGENIPFGAVTWGFTRPESLSALAPDRVFHEVPDLASLARGVAQGLRP